MKILYIVRGIPGSGKSHLAHQLTDHVAEADDFMLDRDGNYCFVKDRLKDCHLACRVRVSDWMTQGIETIAVANTFTRKWEYKPYINMANEYGYAIVELICKSNFKNTHGVSDEILAEMRERFEY